MRMERVIPIFHTEFDALQVGFKGFAKFRQVAILAIFGGYFGYLFPNSWLLISVTIMDSFCGHFGICHCCGRWIWVVKSV